MTIIEILNYVNKSIKTGFADAVEALKKHTYKVSFPDTQKIKGKVEVDFPQVQNVNVKFPDTQKITGNVKTDMEKHFINLLNKVNETKSLIKDKGISVNNFPEIPKEIKISNFPEEKEISLTALEEKLDSLNESIKKLPTKFPEIPKVPDFPKIPAQKDFPKSFSIDNLEILKSDDPKDYVPVRLTDGKEFYKAIEEFYQQVASVVTFTESDGKKSSALVDKDRHVQVDVLTSPPVTIDTSGLATSVKQDNIISILGNGNQMAVIQEKEPTDVTHLNPSLTVTESVLGTVTTKTLTKTIGSTSYVKTVVSDSSDNSVIVSAWSAA